MDRDQVTAVVLAGGEGRRMGGRDKGLVPLAGRPMISHVLDRLGGQVGRIRINANRGQDDYRGFGVPVDGDLEPGFQGPLAGIASAIHHADTRWVVTVPCDTPLLPRDTVARLAAALEAQAADIATARADGRLHPVVALLHRDLLEDLRGYLAAGGRKIDRWFARWSLAEADFEDVAAQLVNVNTPEDLARVEARLEEGLP